MQSRTNTVIPAVEHSTNRYSGYSYNQVGAVTTDGSYALSYDALGQPLSKTYQRRVPGVLHLHAGRRENRRAEGRLVDMECAGRRGQGATPVQELGDQPVGRCPLVGRLRVA